MKKNLDNQIEVAIMRETEKIEKSERKKVEELFSKEMKDKDEKIKEKDKRLQKAEEEELKLRKEKRELDDAKKKFELETARKLDEERKKIFDKATEQVNEENDLKNKERELENTNLKKQITELKRTAEQGSQKLQGEVLELEQVLSKNFNFDDIEPISSGIKGADILQKVCFKTGKVCGTILFESKNAKNWSNGWISKLKNDQRNANADIGVIVTTVLPDGVDNFDMREGVFIVHHKSIVPVTLMLRNQLFEISRTKSFNTGKNEKMETVYNYLTGTEFRHNVETIVEAFA
ncbi:MAG: DUF2130 domain-containing protein [Nanoarchaeota archaeon]|nr:DUF2130 domain-containing protein [Nanoarchaeota archaeon]